jgi:dolichol kinase
MQYNFFTIPVVLLFIGNGFGQLYYAINLKKKFPKEHNLTNSVVIFFLWLSAGLLYPLFYSTFSPNILLSQIVSMLVICVFTPGILVLILLYQFIIIKKFPALKDQRNNNYLSEINTNSDSNTENLKIKRFKTDVYRKLLHLFPIVIIFLLWIYAVYIWDAIWKADEVWGFDGIQYAKILIITFGYAGIFVFAVLDYVRLSYIFPKHNLFYLLPNNVLNLLKKSLKRKEYFEFTKPASLVLSFVPLFLLYPFSIFASAALIATLGDGAASIFGLKFGKHKFPKKSDKTIMGYIMGFLVSLIITILAFLIFEPNLSIIKLIMIALGGALMFLLIDILSLKIDDDILNPILCAIVIGCLFYFI